MAATATHWIAIRGTKIWLRIDQDIEGFRGSSIVGLDTARRDSSIRIGEGRPPQGEPPSPGRVETAAWSNPDGGLDDFSSRHPGGAHFVFADGSVHFLKSVLRDSGRRPDGSTID